MYHQIKNDIIKAMDRGEVTLAVMTDFSKAFDTVDFEILIQKLLPLLKKLKAYLSKLSVSSIRFCVNKTTGYQWSASRKHPGPVLFNIYIYDMKSKTAAECVQYADDTNVLQNWSEETKPVFNAKKTKSNAVFHQTNGGKASSVYFRNKIFEWQTNRTRYIIQTLGNYL